jgi:hypothetical protein
MRAARSGSPPPVRILVKGKIWEDVMERVTEEGPLPLPRNAAEISVSPAMPRWSSCANNVVDFRLVRAWPWRNCQTGHSFETYPRDALRSVLEKHDWAQETNSSKNTRLTRAKEHQSYQSARSVNHVTSTYQSLPTIPTFRSKKKNPAHGTPSSVY